MREREEMKRQIKNYRDKLSNCEKHYKNVKNELKSEKENSEKLFIEISLNEKIIEQMNKTIKDLTSSLQENNEKINYLLSEKSKSAEIIRNLNDYIEKIEMQIKETSELQLEFKELEDNFIKEINNKQDIIKKYENLLGFKNQNIEYLYEKILLVTKNNLSLDDSLQELLKNIEMFKTQSTKKITELERIKIGKNVTGSYSASSNKDYNKMNLKFLDKNTEEEFELLKMENENYKVN
jgi:chromosome segregation ATPase